MSDRKCFLLHNGFTDLFDDLTDEEAGQLIKGLLHFSSGEEPVFRERGASIAFKGIKEFVTASIDKYDRKCEANKENGDKGGRPKKTQQNPSVILETQQNPSVSEEEPKKPIGSFGFPIEEKRIEENRVEDKRIEDKRVYIEPPHPQTVEEVRNFATDEKLLLDAEKFFHYYQAGGWTMFGKPIADWKALARKWSAEDRAKQQRSGNPKTNVYHDSRSDSNAVADAINKMLEENGGFLI